MLCLLLLYGVNLLLLVIVLFFLKVKAMKSHIIIDAGNIAMCAPAAR